MRHRQKVLEDMLKEVIKIDATKGGLFSEPVSREQFPDYYKVVKTPMDYGTMKMKLTHGEYRSAQQMQRDFILVMQNCIKYNAPDSDIVREARRQALSMPGLLRDVCLGNNMFLAEDGAVLDIISDSEENEKKGIEIKAKRGRKKGTKRKDNEEAEDAGPLIKKVRKRRSKKDEVALDPNITVDMLADDGDDDTDENNSEPKAKKPRIRISLAKNKLSSSENVLKDDEEDDDDQPVSSLANFDQGKGKRRPKQERDTFSEHPVVAKSEDSSKKKNKNKKISHRVDAEDKIHLGTPVPRKKIKKMDISSGKTELRDESEPEDGEVREGQSDQDKSDVSLPATAHIDKAKIKQKFDTLDGSFSEARAFFTERGPWALPPTVPIDKDKEVAKILLSKMKKLDQYNLFANPVTEAEAPGYSEIIKKPMDFRTMKEKVEQNEYGRGSDLAKGFYFDILLVMDNCALYNEVNSDVSKEAARILALLPETFASACIAVSSAGGAKISKKKKS